MKIALACSYITNEQHQQLASRCTEIGRMLGPRMRKAESFLTTDL
jgi:hypothetical protein